jgi:hypothetical protein
MAEDTLSPLNDVITIDDERIRSHLDRVMCSGSATAMSTITAAGSWRLTQREAVPCWDLRRLPSLRPQIEFRVA